MDSVSGMRTKREFGKVLCATALFVATVSASCGKDTTGPTGANPFVGTWDLVAFNGNSSSGVTWTFTQSGGLTVILGSQTFTGSYSFDSTTSPRRIDLQLTGATPSPNLGIYIFGSPGSLLIKVQDGATTRATAFTVESGYELEEFAKR